MKRTKKLSSLCFRMIKVNGGLPDVSMHALAPRRLLYYTAGSLLSVDFKLSQQNTIITHNEIESARIPVKIFFHNPCSQNHLALFSQIKPQEIGLSIFLYKIDFLHGTYIYSSFPAIVSPHNFSLQKFLQLTLHGTPLDKHQ